ncbi:MAG TPA: hypothetical protein VMS99_02715 [Acidimicrobiia bacterium]|nr:hypothetical protein [Acidimicrobiia bacterium]
MSILLLASACSSGQADGDTTPTTAPSTVVETSAANATIEPTTTSQADSSETTVPTLSIEACDLVTAEDAAAIIGEVGEADSTPVGPFSSCHYPGTGLFEFVQVQVATGMFDESQFINNAESGAEFLEIEPVEIPDVGDKAYWLGGILWVLSGDVTFNLWIGSSEFAAADGTALEGQALMDAALDVTADTARLIIQRLP